LSARAFARAKAFARARAFARAKAARKHVDEIDLSC